MKNAASIGEKNLNTISICNNVILFLSFYLVITVFVIRVTYKPITVPGVKTSMSVWKTMADAHSCVSILQEATTASVKLVTMQLMQSTSFPHLSIDIIKS